MSPLLVAIGLTVWALATIMLLSVVIGGYRSKKKPKPASILDLRHNGVSPELAWLAYALECQPAKEACQVLGVVFTEEQNFNERVLEAKEQADKRIEDERAEHSIFIKRSNKERYDLAVQVRTLKKEVAGLRDRLRRAAPDDDVTEGVPEPVAEPTSLG